LRAGGTDPQTDNTNIDRRKAHKFRGNRFLCQRRIRVKHTRPMHPLILVLLLFLLLGALPTWPYSAGWGYYPSSGLGLVLIVLVVVALMGRKRL
jgi:hypothetical protein